MAVSVDQEVIFVAPVRQNAALIHYLLPRNRHVVLNHVRNRYHAVALCILPPGFTICGSNCLLFQQTIKPSLTSLIRPRSPLFARHLNIL